MTIRISDPARDLLAQSLPLMEHEKDRLIDGFEAYLRAATPEAEGDSEAAAMMLTEMLIAQTGNLLRSGALQQADDVSREHRALAIDGRHYSRFGDAIVPVLRDVLGPSVPGAVSAAWGDAFWAIVRAVQFESATVDA